MKRLFTLLAILVAFNAYSQNTVTLPSPTTSFTPSFRYYGTLLDSLRQTWMLTPNGGWNRLVTMTEGNLRYAGINKDNYFLGYNNFQDVGIRTLALSPYGNTLIPGDVSAGNYIGSSINNSIFVGLTTKVNGVNEYRIGRQSGGATFNTQYWDGSAWINIFSLTNGGVISGGTGPTAYMLGTANPQFGFIKFQSDGTLDTESTAVVFNAGKTTEKTMKYHPSFYGDQRLHFGSDVMAYVSDITEATTSSSINLSAWTNSFAYTVLSATRDDNEAIITASVIWPDGSTGTFTTDTFSTDFPGAIDAYHVTYVPAIGTTKTITQSLLTRDASGAVIAQPTLTVTP